MQKANYHTHTSFSDGSNLPEVYIEKAILLGLETIGISDHAPIPFHPQKWNMPMNDLHRYFDSISELKEKYSDKIRVLTSLEIDYIPNLVHPLSDFIPPNALDYSIGSIHYLGTMKKGQLFGFELLGSQLTKGLQEVFNGNVVKMVEAYYRNVREMVQNYTPSIIGHVDRIKIINRHQLYFDEQEQWYQDEIKETMKVIAASQSVMEINTKGMYSIQDENPYPSFWILKMAKELEIPIVLSSDAHKPQFLNAGFKEIEDTLNEIGYKSVAKF